jgi:hypothetical protein
MESNNLEIDGRIVSILPMQSGTSKAGNEWKKQDFVLETETQYPKKVCMTMWGEKIDQFNLSEGDKVRAAFDIESREYNGRWYTDVKVWRITKQDGSGNNSGSAGGSTTAPHPANQSNPGIDLSSVDDDELPF